MVAKFDGGPAPSVSGRSRKKMLIAYLLLFFIGTFGAHRFYVGATRSASIMLALALCLVASSVANVAAFGVPISTVLGLVLAGWWLIDLVCTAQLVNRYNARQAMRWDA